ncbi:MAG: hypothetical protein GXZ04_03385 [Clostridiales bacterium]|nr:hypothetical protein [Clostridiales bacterium]
MEKQQARRTGSSWIILAAIVLLLAGLFFLIRSGQIKREYEALAATTPVPSQAPPLLDYRELAPMYRYGSVGPEVIALQERLTELGYYTGGIDGKYYEGTAASVKVFQSQNGLDADGIAGEKTLAVLRSDQAKRYQPPVEATGSPSPNPTNQDGSYNKP